MTRKTANRVDLRDRLGKRSAIALVIGYNELPTAMGLRVTEVRRRSVENGDECAFGIHLR
jgi:hypothetical protein